MTIITADNVEIDPQTVWVYTYPAYASDGIAVRTRLQFDNANTRQWGLKTFFGEVPFFANQKSVEDYIKTRESAKTS